MSTDGRGVDPQEPLEESIGFVLDSAGIAWWHLDLRSNTTARSPLHDRLFGHPEPVPSWSFEDFLSHVHPDDRAMAAAAFTEASTGGAHYAIDVRVVWPDGSVHWLFTQGRFLHDEDGTPVRVAGMVTDITNRKLVELSAAASEAQTVALLETLLGSAPVGFAFVDRDLRFARINEALAEMNGLSAADHLGRTVAEVVPDLWPLIKPAYDTVFDQGEAVLGVEVSGETPAAPGVDRHWLVSFYPVRIGGEGEVLGVGVVANDVTERVRLEAHLRQSQKLEAVGLLAGGVAHDFNNALAAVIMSAELARRDLGRADLDSHLERILRAAGSASGLTRQLLQFSRQEPVRVDVVDVVASIRAVLSFLDATLGEHIRLRLDLQPVPPVRMDPTQLHQVLVNLAINARDAMPGGGELTVTTSTATLHDLPPGLAPGRYIDLRVSDTGVGMSRDVLERAFEPFFTTRSDLGGTGLGLATAYGMVQGAGGELTIDSVEGEGTSIRVLLPETKEAPTAEPVAAPPPAGQGQRVVVVEDQADVGRSVEEVLRAAGYVVTGATAEQVLADPDAPCPDLLLTDVVMPGVSGPDLVRALAERWPDLRVLYMSGYTDGMLADQGVDLDATRLVRKPFASDDLLREVAGALSGGAGPGPTAPGSG